MPQFETNITNKSLDFIADKDLQIIIENRLKELDQVFAVNANLSTIILSISSVEGIFQHLALIFKGKISNSPNFPTVKGGKRKGKKKRISELSIEEIYSLLLEENILQRIENFENIYKLFRQYRNFIHPIRQKNDSWPVGLGQAQMAIGLLNATIEQISNHIFLGSEIFERISGKPVFDIEQVLHLNLTNVRTNSFIVSKRTLNSNLVAKFNIDLGQEGIFNFVFNFRDQANFKMLRIDSRNIDRCPNALLHCNQKHYWKIVAEAQEKQPPQGDLSVAIDLDSNKKKFDFKVNGKSYIFFTKGKQIDLYSEFKKDLKIGWFNEADPVKVSNIILEWT